jgi:hypothetical protein
MPSMKWDLVAHRFDRASPAVTSRSARKTIDAQGHLELGTACIQGTIYDLFDPSKAALHRVPIDA